MELLKIVYSVELSEEEAKILYNAENLLREILEKMDKRDIGDFNAPRKKVDAALEKLNTVNCELCVHMKCDENY